MDVAVENACVNGSDEFFFPRCIIARRSGGPVQGRTCGQKIC